MPKNAMKVAPVATLILFAFRMADLPHLLSSERNACGRSLSIEGQQL